MPGVARQVCYRRITVNGLPNVNDAGPTALDIDIFY